MSKNKKVGLAVSISIITVLAISGGTFALLKTHKPSSSLSAQELADNAASAASQDADTTTNSATQLNPTQTATTTTPSATTSTPTAPSQKATTTTTPSLGVSGSSSSTSLGQLNSSNQSTSGASAGNSTSSGSSSSSANSNPFDPTTFAQYDKYKSETSAEYGDVQVGTGATLASGQTAQVYYRGWLTNGTMFDQSRTDSSGKLQPFSFTVGSHQVIAGWEEGLVGMKVGGVRLLIVPPSVGYGDTAQSSIPANSVLIFQVQLAAVQ